MAGGVSQHGGLPADDTFLPTRHPLHLDMNDGPSGLDPETQPLSPVHPAASRSRRLPVRCATARPVSRVTPSLKGALCPQSRQSGCAKEGKCKGAPF